MSGGSNIRGGEGKVMGTGCLGTGIRDITGILQQPSGY